jgi:hypothetical protein
MVQVHRSQVTSRRVDDSLLLVESTSFSLNGSRRGLHLVSFFVLILILVILHIAFCLRLLFFLLVLLFVLWTRIIDSFNFLDHVISDTYDMNFSVNSVTASSHVSVK